jgi:cobalt-zinc-cadmium resistance protein CzcA
MIESVIRQAYRLRWVSLALAAGVAALGVWSFRNSKVEAYPDISGVTVTVITTYPGRAAEEVEREVTIPIERAMGSVPRVETIRSRTIFGLSVIILSFEDGVEPYWARLRVQEQLTNAVNLPKSANANLSPLISSAGEVIRYEVRGDGTKSLMDLRTLHDWVITPRLLRVPGVGDVANFGGDLKQFAVVLKPAELQRFRLALSDVTDAVSKNNSTSGGSVITRGSMSFVIRGRGMVRDEDEIGRIFIKSVDGTPIYVRHVADVRAEAKVPTGIFGKDDRDNTIEGLVTLRKGENPSVVVEKIKAAIEELNDDPQMEGARLELIYDRSHLVSKTLETVAHSVGMGISLVIVMLLLFLGSPRLAGLVALTIPFALLFAITLMYAFNIPLGLLSLGAIDFGIIVDGAVIVADHIAHRLGKLPPGSSRRLVRRTILSATLEVQRPVFFAVLMIIGVHIPLLTLVRIEGLLFRPMAIMIVCALVGCLIFALLIVPVLASILLARGYREWENPLLRVGRPAYRWLVGWLVHLRWIVGPLGLLGLAATIWWLLPRMGTEFLPYMDEGTIWIKANFPEGTSIEQTAKYADRIREIVREFEDIDFVSSRSGRTDSGLDPFPPSRIEMLIGPKPREQWKHFASKHDLIKALGERLRAEFPTARFNFTQPIIDNVTEESNGTSANLAVDISGPETVNLLAFANQTVELLRSIPGAVDVAIEQEGPQPQLVVVPDRARCARLNVRIEDVNALVNTALGGDPVANLFEGDRVFDIVVKFDRSRLHSPEAVRQLPVFTTEGIAYPLGMVADVDVRDGQTLIAREGGKRRLTVRCDIVGRDQGGFVAEAQRRFAEEIQPKIPRGCKVSWVGMFENLERAKEHFHFVGPITIAILFSLLVITFGSIRGALVVTFALPGAFIGGAMAIYLRGMNVNVSVGVGFAALFGVAIMDGVLMLQRIAALRQLGMPIDDAIKNGAAQRIRPVLMTSLVAMLGLLPASFATGLGSDVQRPLATVIVWGLLSSTTVTLFLVPVLYRLLSPPVPRSKMDDDLADVTASEDEEAPVESEPHPDDR